MAKSLTSAQIEALTQATKNVDRLTRLQVFTLATSGLVDVEDGAFIITSKGDRAIKRQVRGQALEANVPVVMAAALEILDSLRALREEGILDTVKLSGNNFQVFWKRGAAAALIGPVAPQIEAAPVEVIVEA